MPAVLLADLISGQHDTCDSQSVSMWPTTTKRGPIKVSMAASSSRQPMTTGLDRSSAASVSVACCVSTTDRLHDRGDRVSGRDGIWAWMHRKCFRGAMKSTELTMETLREQSEEDN